MKADLNQFELNPLNPVLINLLSFTRNQASGISRL